jgi:hypothetical protein
MESGVPYSVAVATKYLVELGLALLGHHLLDLGLGDVHDLHLLLLGHAHGALHHLLLGSLHHAAGHAHGTHAALLLLHHGLDLLGGEVDDLVLLSGLHTKEKSENDHPCTVLNSRSNATSPQGSASASRAVRARLHARCAAPRTPQVPHVFILGPSPHGSLRCVLLTIVDCMKRFKPRGVFK